MPAENQHLLSVAIVVYHTPVSDISSMLDSLLQALIELRKLHPHEGSTITLVDNSEDCSLTLEDFSNISEKLISAGTELRLIQGQGNVGYGAAHNLALAKASSNFHLLMNPDIELDSRSLLLGINYLLENSSVGAVSPCATYADGSKQYLCKNYPSVSDFFLRGFMPAFVRKLFASKLAKYEMRYLPEDQPSEGIPIISGCFILCSTDALRQVSGFDENYFLYFEDFDLSLRLSKKYKLSYLPSMKIVHHGGHSARKGSKHIGLFARSGRRFFSSYGWRWF